MYIEIRQAADGQHYNVLRGNNHEDLMVSELYPSHSIAIERARAIQFGEIKSVVDKSKLGALKQPFTPPTGWRENQ